LAILNRRIEHLLCSIDDVKMMKITINISKEDAQHLSSPHTFHDECETACIQLRKMQKEIDKKMRKKRK
jgi:hypothetical protein